MTALHSAGEFSNEKQILGLTRQIDLAAMARFLMDISPEFTDLKACTYIEGLSTRENLLRMPLKIDWMYYGIKSLSYHLWNVIIATKDTNRTYDDALSLNLILKTIVCLFSL